MEEVLVEVRPDWVGEILSTNRRNDLVRKKRVYHRHQVPHYWILDPDEGTLTVHRWAPEGYLEIATAERGEEVRPEPFRGDPVARGGAVRRRRGRLTQSAGCRRAHHHR